MISDADVNDRIARDVRLKAVQLGIDISHELSESRPLRVVVDAFQEDARRAMLEFVNVNPSDQAAVMGIQARVYRSVRTVELLKLLQDRAVGAENSLRDEDRAQPEIPQ